MKKVLFLSLFLMILLLTYLLFFYELYDDSFYFLKGLFFMLWLNICYLMLVLLSNKLNKMFLRRYKVINFFNNIYYIKNIKIYFIVLILLNITILLFGFDSIDVIEIVFYLIILIFYVFIIITPKKRNNISR